MNEAALSVRNLLRIVGAVLLVGVLGLVYVYSFALGWRAIFVVHTGALFFLGAALYLRDIKAFFLFILVFCTSLQFTYHLIHQPLTVVESQPFISGLPIDIVDVALVILYARWVLMLSTGHAPFRLKLGHPLGTLFVLWIAWCFAVSLIQSKMLNYSLFEVFILVKGFLLYFYLVNNTLTLKDLRVVVYALFATTVCHSLYMVVQYITGLNYTLHGEIQRDIGSYGGFRSTGFFGSWDAASAMISFILPALLVYLVTVPSRTKRFAAVASVSVVLAALMCAKVRAAWFAVLISSSLALLLSYRWGWISSSRLLKLAMLAFLTLLLISPFVVARFQGGTWWEDRAPLQQTALRMIKDHWLFGVGVNNYPFNIEDYVPPQLRHAWAYTVHNEYLLRMAETGVVGFILYYSMVILAVRKLWQASHTRNVWVYVFSVGLLSAFVGSVPYRMVSFYHYLNLFLQFCVILAVTASLDTVCAEGESFEAMEAACINDPDGSRHRRLPGRA
jgi:hypothetical protein